MLHSKFWALQIIMASPNDLEYFHEYVNTCTTIRLEVFVNAVENIKQEE